MLFILAMEILNKLFHRASEENLLQPIGHGATKYRASFYADDVIILVTPSALEFGIIKRILKLFEAASGLPTSKVEICTLV